jgi:hypothetical protein
VPISGAEMTMGGGEELSITVKRPAAAGEGVIVSALEGTIGEGGVQ